MAIVCQGVVAMRRYWDPPFGGIATGTGPHPIAFGGFGTAPAPAASSGFGAAQPAAASATAPAPPPPAFPPPPFGATDEIARLRAELEESQLRTARAESLVESIKVRFPLGWTAQADDGGDRSTIGWWRDGRTLVSVPMWQCCGASYSEEWQWCSELLRSTLPTATLVRLERWENRLQFRDYWVRRRRIELKRGGESNERWLWHGTGRTPPATVLAHEVGPDPRFASGGFYGKA